MRKSFVQRLWSKSKHILQSTFLFFENRAVYEIIWKNTVRPGRPQTTVWRMRIACWIPEATNTHLAYVILIAFPLQQWLHERASMLRYITSPVLLVSLRDTRNFLSELPYFSDIYELLCFFDYVAG